MRLLLLGGGPSTYTIFLPPPPPFVLSESLRGNMPPPTPIRGRERRGGGVPFSYRPMTIFPPPFILGFLCKAGTVEKRSARAIERDEWLRLVWRFTFGKLDSRRLVFVDEMGPIPRLLFCTSTHLTVNEPSLRGRETGSRTPPFWRAWVGK